MQIKRIKNYNKNTLEDLNMLLLQLSSSGYQMQPNHLKKVIRNKNNYLFALYDKKLIIGTVTLIKVNQIRRTKGVIEDFVVDQNYRGRKLGGKLILHVIKIAKKLKISQLLLTSKPYRIAANKLYKKLGFTIKETNVYIMEL